MACCSFLAQETRRLPEVRSVPRVKFFVLSASQTRRFHGTVREGKTRFGHGRGKQKKVGPFVFQAAKATTGRFFGQHTMTVQREHEYFFFVNINCVYKYMGLQ